jgi:hypothetical protein
VIATIFSDPVFQIGIVSVVVGTIALLLAVRSQVATHPVAVARGTRVVLALAVLGMLLVSGWSGWHVFSVPQKGAVISTSPTAAPTPTPTGTPTEEPSPTATPHLARSITQVLTGFCQDITARNYVAAWNVYATSLQRQHPYTAVRTSWSHYVSCGIASQAGDPDAISILIFTLAPGQTDQYGFTGDTFIAFTMGVENSQWKITSACHQIAEGCFALEWG